MLAWEMLVNVTEAMGAAVEGVSSRSRTIASRSSWKAAGTWLVVGSDPVAAPALSRLKFLNGVAGKRLLSVTSKSRTVIQLL
jgi:hypothetical protein